MAVTPAPQPAPNSVLLQRVLRAIRRHALCSPDDCLIVAVSGGADSVALLDLLATLPHFRLRLVVAHLNHQLRGEASDADQQFVQELAACYNYPCVISCCDIRLQAAQSGQSLEETGREARYRFFEETRQCYGAAAIAVGHHADDQAETLLLRLIRGSGTTGLSAMVPRNRIGIIRPLLDISREDIRYYLAGRGIGFREDASNSDQTYLRNRIRHQLLPLLTKYNPAIADRLAATAQLLQEDQALLDDYTHAHYQELATSSNGWVALPRTRLLKLRSGLRTRLYQLAIKQLQGSLQRIERTHLFQLDACLFEGRTGSSQHLPNGLVMLVTADLLVIGYHQRLYPAQPITLTITDCGCYDLGNGLSLQIEPATAPAAWHDLPPTTTYVDLQQAPFPWQLRPHAPGERMEPLGMSGSRRIQDILTDKKIPRHLRPALPLLGCRNQTIWLAGVCRSRHGLVQQGRGSILRIRFHGMELFTAIESGKTQENNETCTGSHR